MFISKPHAGMIYVAVRSRKNARRKLLWSVLPWRDTNVADVRIEVDEVPKGIRRQAYKTFERQRDGRRHTGNKEVNL
jgi:hypothetical protein